MPKPNKSSASSGTRKKHLRKKDGPADDPVQERKPKKEKGKKGSKLEPRPKVYIPPVKPAPVRPDPIETSGLGHTLPSELLVVLRNLGKKAVTTKSRALLELQSGWIEKAIEAQKSGSSDEGVGSVLVEMLPVWVRASHCCRFFGYLTQSNSCIIFQPCSAIHRDVYATFRRSCTLSFFKSRTHGLRSYSRFGRA